MTGEEATRARVRKALEAASDKSKPEPGGLGLALTGTMRKYQVHLKVIDPDGQEILNLTKLAFEQELHRRGFCDANIEEALVMLVEAAGEWGV